MAVTYSELTRSLLKEMVEKIGPDTAVTAEEAERIYGGKSATTIGQLSNVQLLQLALFEAYAMLADITKHQP
jgi:hypothetical protein